MGAEKKVSGPVSVVRDRKEHRMGEDDLKILIDASLDEVKSLQNILADLRKLQEKIKTYRLKVQAGLDQSASAAQIKSDLEKIAKPKNRLKIVGQDLSCEICATTPAPDGCRGEGDDRRVRR